MQAVVPIVQIRPNPFQSRGAMGREGIRSLADEIKDCGLWPGALRGRWRGGKVELCFGHRRLEALKILGWKEAPVEIEDLSDEEMALQSLSENMQREGLSDIDRAKGIAALLRRLRERGLSEPEAMSRVTARVGLSPAWVRDLLSLLKTEKSVQDAVSTGQISGRTAIEAHRFGGAKMVSTAIKHKLPVHKISELAKRVRSIPDAAVRTKVEGEVSSGRIHEPDQVTSRAKDLLKGRKLSPPKNLDALLTEWVEKLSTWSRELETLDSLAPFVKRSNLHGELAGQARTLAAKLKALS